MLKKSEPNLLNSLLDPSLELTSQRDGLTFDAIASPYLNLIDNLIIDGIVIMDKEGIVTYLNDAAQQLLGVIKSVIGVDRQALITNRPGFTQYKLEYLYDPVKSFQEALTGQTITDKVIKVASLPPRLLDTTYKPLRDQNNQVIGVFASFRDVTVLKQQQEEIARQLALAETRHKRWDALFNNVEEGICLLDPQGRIIDFNPTSELLSGYLKREVLGKRYYEVFKCHDSRGHYLEDTLIRKVLLTQESLPYDEHLHTTRDGKEVWAGSSCMPIFDEKGEIEQLVMVVRDITAYKQVEKLKSEFVSIASHELRTPLTIVNGYLALLTNGDLGDLSDPTKKEQHQKIIQKVYLETRRLNSLVEDLLNISRIEEGRLKIELTPTDLVKLVKETISDYRPLAQEKGLALDYVGSETRVMVDCDTGKIKQVLTNMIDNAIKYTEKGSIKVDLALDGGYVITSVADTGNGIPARLKELIFEKFQQAPGSYLKENKGTGLGLFIVKGIVELHQGRVWVDSVLRQGSVFHFSLPSRHQAEVA